jgi:hypothetical protein
MKEKNFTEDELAKPGEDAEEETARKTRVPLGLFSLEDLC